MDLAVDVGDYDGDPISTSTITGAAFTKNLDGTFTLSGHSRVQRHPDTVCIGATDSGSHYHQGTTIFDYRQPHQGGGHRDPGHRRAVLSASKIVRCRGLSATR